MSPLAHAHVDGVDAGHSVYSHDFDPYAGSGDSQVGNLQGAVIGMSLAYPASDGPVVTQAQLAPLVSFSVAKVSRSRMFADGTYAVPAQIPTRHALPWSQAPPA